VTARAEWLTIVGDPARWRSIGLTVTDQGLIPLMGTSLRLVAGPSDDSAGAPAGRSEDPDSPPDGIVGWALSDAPGSPPETVDGLATEYVASADPVFAAHDLGVSGLDHVVVLTPDLQRTSEAIALTTGCELKRIREVGEMRQGFHRIGRGGLIVELVERPDVPEGPATFWGLVMNVDDLDAAYAMLGPDRVSTPKDAVQPGRRIATLRNSVGLGLPVALMTP